MREKITGYIKTWEDRCYSNGLPDEVPRRLMELKKAPSYKQICLCILRNDLKPLGIIPKVSQHYHTLKKIELGVKDHQLKLF